MKRSEFVSPEDVYGQLFYEVHRQGLFEDGKVFADATARLHPDIIVKTFREESQKKGFQLSTFIKEYFDLPQSGHSGYDSSDKSINEHLSQLWEVLHRTPDQAKKYRSSKIPLPYPYIVPGGRFNEIYYWDSYFTLLGLKRSGRNDLVEHMLQNFRHMIRTIGFIPNGNRSYFLSRSQPPFYSLMIKLLIGIKGAEIIPEYLPSLVAEYNFWMKGLESLSEPNIPNLRVIRMEQDVFLNRYYDDKNTPRVEMYRDDWALIDFREDRHDELFRELRAACESGWDFSSRWLADPQDLSSILTTRLLPIDLNCLLWHLEKLISECYLKLEENELSFNYGILAHKRKKAIQGIFWNEEEGFFYDYNWHLDQLSEEKTLAGMYPLFFKLCTEKQARMVKENIEKYFLKDGGLITTLKETGQQWDAPNGWAPLHWIAAKGLANYQFKDLAEKIASRWTQLNRTVFSNTGKMLEKYDVMDMNTLGGGGEYPVQDGFGWTNGVYLAMTAK